MTKQTISQISGIQNEEYDKVTIAPEPMEPPYLKAKTQWP